MTLSITFYDGILYHRNDFLYRDSDFIGNGVVVATEFPFAIPATPNMGFTIGQGRAWVDGFRIQNDSSPVGLVVTAADATNPRIDIVQIGHDDINSTYSLVVKKGTAAGSPVEPGPDAGYTKLWAIAVAANQTTITAGNFTDRRILVPLNISGAQISLAGAAGTGIANAFSGNQTLNPLGTATSGGNFATYELGFSRSVWSGSVAQLKTSFFQVDVTGKLIFINEAAATVWSLDQAGNESARTFTSTVAIGTAPFTVTSTTLVSNLNAQFLNGNAASAFATAASLYQTIALSANTTLTAAQTGIIDVTTGASVITITLPSAVAAQLSYTIKKADAGAGTITIATTSSQLIDGASTKTITFRYDYIQVISDGTGWQIVDGSVFATQVGTDNSTLAATTAWVRTAIATYAPVPAAASPTVLGTVMVAATPLSGGPFASTRVGNAIESQLTTTSITNVLSYTPLIAGNFMVNVSARVVTGATNLTVSITYNDVTGAQTNAYYPLTSVAVGTHQIGIPLFINAVSGTAIIVKVTAGTANQAFISASIVGV